MPNRSELINENTEIQDELERLGVKREYVNFHKLDDEEVEVFVEAKRDQLATRKRFLGEKLEIWKK